MNWEFYGDDNENILIFDPLNKYPTDCDNVHSYHRKFQHLNFSKNFARLLTKKS